MKPLISFIIPIYNVEKYLHKCVDSIINQEIDNYEILLINDGSNDRSPQICDNYAKQYSNVKVFHTENRGQSAARNTGIMNSNGKYIFFIDSDDYYIDGALRYFKDVIDENLDVDLVLGKIRIFYENSDRMHAKTVYKNLKAINGMSGEKAFQYLVKTNQFLVSPYSFMVKRSILVDNHILFDEKMRCAEDIFFTPQVYFKAKKVVGIDEFFLMYRKNREDQLTHNITLEKEKSVLFAIDKSVNEVDSYKIDKVTKAVFKRYLSSIYVTSLSKDSNTRNVINSERYGLLKEYKHLIDYSGGKRFLIPKVVYKVFGYNVYILVLKFMKVTYDKFRKAF